MKIDLDVDSTALILRLKNGEKRLVYAVAEAINNTAKQVQKAEFANIDDEFTLRNRPFFFGTPERPGGVAARIKPFASVRQSRLHAEVYVAQASTIKSQRSLLLSIFERGGERKPGKTTAVPLTGGPARPSFSQGVDPKFTFAGMKLHAFKGGKKQFREVRGSKGRVRRKSVGLFGEFGKLDLSRAGGGAQFKGLNRTFLIPDAGVFQRTGPGRSGIRKVWSFRKGIKLKQRLGWQRVAITTSNRWFKEEMQRGVVKAIARARGQGL